MKKIFIASATFIVFINSHALPYDYTLRINKLEEFHLCSYQKTPRIIMMLTPMFGFLINPSAINIIHHTPCINAKPMPVHKLMNSEPASNTHILYDGIFRD